MKHLTQFFVGSLRTGQLEVVAHRTAHQGIALGYKDEVLTGSLADGLLLPVGVKKDDFTDIRLDEIEHQTEQSGLANASGSHDSGLATWLEIVAEVMHHGTVAGGVAEGDIA